MTPPRYNHLYIAIVLILTVTANNVAASFVGLWEGIDNLDGATMRRSFVLTSENNYTITGSIEFSQICGGDISGNITAPPDVTEQLIPAVLSGFGSIDDEGDMVASLGITCFGEEGPRIAAIPIVYQMTEGGVMKEVPAFREDDPIYFFRIGGGDYDASPSATSAGMPRSFRSVALLFTILASIGCFSLV